MHANSHSQAASLATQRQLKRLRSHAARGLRYFSAALLCASSAFAATLTGTVTNGTTGRPSPGDTVAAVNMAQSMDEIAKTTSDSSGVFHLTLPDDGQILLHITHRGAEYFKALPPRAATIDIEVYDGAARLSGISAEAMVFRFETDSTGKTLHVSENFFVKNDSAPPKTEVGGNTFDFFMPKGAQVVQSIASTPNGLPTDVKLTTIDEASGHYGFTFPLRPGETLFQVIYTLPYSGTQSFKLKLGMETGDVAVVLPKAMQFDGSSQFQPIEPDPSTQNFDAHKPGLDQPIQFTVAGIGVLPQRQDAGQSAAQGSQDQSSEASQSTQPPVTRDSRPGGGLGVPDDPEGTNDPWAKYKGFILGGLGLALAIGAAIMLRSGRPQTVAVATPQAAGDITAPAGQYIEPALASTPPATAPTSNPLLHTLKDELFALEADRLSGKLTDTQYAEQKAAFDVLMRRAINRDNPS